MRITPILASGQGLIPLMAVGGCAFVCIVIGAFFIRSSVARERKRGEILVWSGIGLIVVIIFLWPLFLKL